MLVFSDLSLQLLINRLGRCATFFRFWAFDFDFCTPVGSGSLELRLCWICTSEEDKWLIFWDSVKSNLLTRRENGKGNWKKMNPVVPTPKSTHMLHHHRKPSSQSRHVLLYLSWLAAELSLQLSAVVAEAVWQKPCPRSTHLEVYASALLCPFVLFSSIRFIVELKPNQQSCVFGVGSWHINLGTGWGGLGWG